MLSKNQIKEIQSLHLKKQRDKKKLFIAEGIKSVSELLQHAPSIVKELFAIPDFIHSHQNELIESKVNATLISEEELRKISLQSNPNAVLAVCHYFEEENSDFNFNSNFSLYLDDVRDPGNLGTIIRLADWFGISTIFVSKDSCDFYNPKVIQSTMGAFLRVKIKVADLQEIIIKNKVLHIYGAVLEGKNIYKQKLQHGIIVIGNEANGISEENLKLINHAITIPSHLQNGTESLNAAMAASIITSEFFRQLKI